MSQLGIEVDAAVRNLAMAAFNRPADFPAIIEEMEASLDRFENKLPPGILAAKVAAARTTIGESAVAGLIEKDPATALAALEGGTFDRVLAPPGKALVLKQARAAVAVRDKAAGAEVAAAIEDHLVSLRTTGAGLGGIAERARAALDRKAFKAFERDEKDARAFHETIKSLKFAPPEVIDRELESRRPKRGARNFEDRQRRFQVLERGAKQMLNVRARDGAAFVMEIGDVRAAVEGAGTDGPDLRRALKFRMAMQSEIGIPEDRVRLLTRAEAGALASQVQSAAVEDRAAKVTEVQDLYGPLFGRAMKELSDEGLDPRYRALAGARDNPALARTIAKALEPGAAGPEQALDPAGSQEVRGRVRDLTADAHPDADSGGEIAEGIGAILSAAEALGVEYLRQTGRVEESAARAAAFANSAIEETRLAAADGGNGEDRQPPGKPPKAPEPDQPPPDDANPGGGDPGEPPKKPSDPEGPPKKPEPDPCPEPPPVAEIAAAEKAVKAAEIAINETQAEVDNSQADVEKAEGEPEKTREPMEAAQKKVDEVRAEIAQLEEERARIDRNDPPIKVRPDSELPKEMRGINIDRRFKLVGRATPGGALASQRRRENKVVLAHQRKELDKANAELEKARAKHEKTVAVLKTAQAGLDAATAALSQVEAALAEAEAELEQVLELKREAEECRQEREE